jgi:hypothetical protein
MDSETTAAALNSSHIRAVSATLRLVEEAVDRIERLLIDPVTRITFRLADDLDAEERRTIQAACERARAALIQARDRLKVEIPQRSRRGAIRGEVSTLWVMMEDTKSPALRGYGPLSSDGGRVVDEVLDEISTTLIGILRLVA